MFVWLNSLGVRCDGRTFFMSFFKYKLHCFDIKLIYFSFDKQSNKIK